jgi:4'-phosphopantetheinyl transferase EntD
VVGSITHCDSYTAAAVCSDRHFRSLGIDAEINQPLPEGVLSLIASSNEQVTLNRLRDSSISWDRLLFSAKESIFKAWFPVAQRWLDFLAAEVTFDRVHLTFRAELLVESPPTGASFVGRFSVVGAHLLTAVALPVR